MTTAGQRRVLRLTTAWLLASVVVVAWAELLSLTYWFLFAFLGFLVVVELTAPMYVAPAWRARLRIPLAVGVLVFAVLVVQEGSDTTAQLLDELTEAP